MTVRLLLPYKISVYYEGTIKDWCNITIKGFVTNPMHYAKHFYFKNENDEYVEFDNLVIPNGVEKIGECQFVGLNFKSIEIPKSVKYIGEEAFAPKFMDGEITDDGASLKKFEGIYYNGTAKDWLNVEIDGLDYSPMIYAKHCYFKNENNEYVELENLVIPDGTTKINQNQFAGFNLKTVEIPKSVKKIKYDAFRDNYSLVNVYYNGTLEDWLKIEFEDVTSNPMYYAKHFYLKNENGEYEELNNIVLPKGIRKIGPSQFAGSKAKSLELPGSLKTIYSSAFNSCCGFTNITLNGSSLSVCNHSFSCCQSLTTVTLLKDIELKRGLVFIECHNLTNVYYNGTLEEWKAREYMLFRSHLLDYVQKVYVKNSSGEYEKILIDISKY